MNRTRLLIALITSVLLIGGTQSLCAQSSGSEIYIPKCAGCHGTKGIVASEYMKSRGTPNATDPYIQSLTANQMFSSVKNGKQGPNGEPGMMPFKNRLTDAQIREAVAFFRELGNAAPNAPVQESRVEPSASTPAPLPPTPLNTQITADKLQPFPNSVEVDVMRKDGLELLVKNYQQHKNACEHAANGTDQKQNFQMMKSDAIPIRDSAQHLFQVNSNSPTALALLIDLDSSLAMFRRPEDAPMLKEAEQLQPRLLQAIRTAPKPEGNAGDQWNETNSSIRVVCLRALGYAAFFGGDYATAQQSLKEVVAAQPDGMDRGSISLLASAYLSARPPVVDGLFWAAKYAIVSGNSLDYAKDQYIKYHGGDAGFDDLVEAARTNPTIPARYAAAPPVAPLKLPSIYISAQAPTDKLQLNADNSFSLQEGGQPYHGTFTANGATIDLNISETSTKTTLRREGDNLTDSSGQMWSHREQSVGTAPSGAALHNDDIIKLVTVGIDDATITAKIKSSKCQFDTSTDALVLLKKSGVSATVLKAMVGAGK